MVHVLLCICHIIIINVPYFLIVRCIVQALTFEHEYLFILNYKINTFEIWIIVFSLVHHVLYNLKNNWHTNLFDSIRHCLHPTSRTGIHCHERRVPKASEGSNSDILGWLWHMLQCPNCCTHNNIHFRRHECDTTTRQHTHPQHSRQHHMLGHGSRTWQCELGAKCDSQYAATEPSVAFWRTQFKAWRGPWAMHLILLGFLWVRSYGCGV